MLRNLKIFENYLHEIITILFIIWSIIYACLYYPSIEEKNFF